MPKVELTKIRLAVTAITETVVATIPSKNGITMLHKQDVHSDFLRCIIDFGANTRFNISAPKGEKAYQVMVAEKGKHKNEIYRRNKVLSLIKQACEATADGKIALDDWVKENLK
jgi:hypothetical protein